MAVCVLGMAVDAIKGVVEMVTEECRAGGTLPLIITDNPHIARFIPMGMRVEYVNDVDDARAKLPTLDWSQYQAQQFELIGRRWRPVQVVIFGRRLSRACFDALHRGARQPL